MSFHSIHNVVDRGVLQAMWEQLAGKVGHRDQLIICNAYLKTLHLCPGSSESSVRVLNWDTPFTSELDLDVLVMVDEKHVVDVFVVMGAGLVDALRQRRRTTAEHSKHVHLRP